MKISYVLLLVFTLSSGAQTNSPPQKTVDNFALQGMVDEDQRVRTGQALTPLERSTIYKTDADRRVAVKQLIASGQLETGQDFRNAALILQHSTQSNDYLLAHTLAMIAAGKGNKDGLWLASATLDRYLISVKQSQIYGTQYNHFDQTKPWTQEPYSPNLIPDTLRKLLNVQSLAEQKKQL